MKLGKAEVHLWGALGTLKFQSHASDVVLGVDSLLTNRRQGICSGRSLGVGSGESPIC